MLGIQNVGLNSNSVNFTAKRNQKADADKPFKTQAGLKTGAAYAALIGTSAIAFCNNASNKAMKKSVQGALKFILPMFLIGSVITGFAIDKKINAKHAELHDKLQEDDLETIQAEDDRVQTTKEGNPYYKSALGKKIGTAIGAFTFPALTLADKILKKSPAELKLIGKKISKTVGAVFAPLFTLADKIFKKPPVKVDIIYKNLGKAASAAMSSTSALTGKILKKSPAKINFIIDVVLGSLVGLMLGGITDAGSNRAARKHADKTAQAVQEAQEAYFED